MPRSTGCGEQPDRIERALARRHLKNGALVLYDISSSYVEGRCCELARHGYSRDRRPDRLQIVYGLLCDRDGWPIAVEVFEGDVGDPSTLSAQISKLKQRFGLEHVVLVGDRGMITSAPHPRGAPAGRAGLDHRAARAADPGTDRERAAAALAVRRAQSGRDHRARLSRRAAGRLPQSRARRASAARKRDELLAATERDLSRIVAHVRRRYAPLRGKAEIGLASAP